MAFKLFQRARRSLFGEILYWMLTPLVFLLPISLTLTWLVAQNIAGKPFDRALEHDVQALAKLVHVEGGRLQFSLTASAREILRADDIGQAYYQVRDPTGKYLSGELDMPLPIDEDKPAYGEIKLRDDVMRGQAVRVAYTWLRPEAATAPASSKVLLQVAQTLEKRKTLATEIMTGSVVPQFVTLPLAVLLVWLALVRGIKPLAELEKGIRARRSDDMSPLEETAVPEELSPLVSSINDLLSRLQISLSTQKRFLADAAHQLKTPLAGLRMQADLAQRQTDAQELKNSLKQIGRASVRATHTVNQLLALARAENAGRSLAKQRLDLVPLVAEVMADSVPRALEKHIDLGYDGPDAEQAGEATQLEGNPTLLKELIRNLLDNAIQYTPEHGQITLQLIPVGAAAVLLVVEDTGPGIPEAERERVLEPFYRALGSNVDGSGLGLALVVEIVKQHGASLTLEDARLTPGSGTRVTVRFAPSRFASPLVYTPRT